MTGMVMCSGPCGKPTPRKGAWRKRVLFSQGDGGSLGRVKLMKSLDVYLCSACMRDEESGGQETLAL